MSCLLFRRRSRSPSTRGHDNIGWAVTDEDARAVGLNGPLHRAFPADFYKGDFPGFCADGELFQHNPKTGDKRNSGPSPRSRVWSGRRRGRTGGG